MAVNKKLAALNAKYEADKAEQIANLHSEPTSNRGGYCLGTDKQSLHHYVNNSGQHIVTTDYEESIGELYFD